MKLPEDETDTPVALPRLAPLPLVPMKLFRTTFPVAPEFEIDTPAVVFPPIVLAPAVVAPPIVLAVAPAPNRIPVLLGTTVPEALRPIVFLSMRLVDPRRWMPLWVLPAIRLPVPLV